MCAAAERGESLSAGYDHDHWAVVASKSADLGRSPKLRVLLVGSRVVTQESAAGARMHDADLIILEGPQVLYRHRLDSRRPANDDCTDGASLEVRDVTRDGVPEVLFRCGRVGVSDYVARLHIVHYDSRERSFHDVARPEFRDGGLGHTLWYRIGKSDVVVTADAEWRLDESHYQPHYFTYTIYCWAKQSDEFAPVHTVHSDQQVDVEHWRVDLRKHLDELLTTARSSSACRE